MTTRDFTGEEIEDLDIPWGDAVFETIDTGEWRWGVEHEAIVKFEDAFWCIPYRSASGDSEIDFEDAFWGFPVKATKVEKQPVVTYKWVEVNE